MDSISRVNERLSLPCAPPIYTCRKCRGSRGKAETSVGRRKFVRKMV